MEHDPCPEASVSSLGGLTPQGAPPEDAPPLPFGAPPAALLPPPEDAPPLLLGKPPMPHCSLCSAVRAALQVAVVVRSANGAVSGSSVNASSPWQCATTGGTSARQASAGRVPMWSVASPQKS